VEAARLKVRLPRRARAHLVEALMLRAEHAPAEVEGAEVEHEEPRLVTDHGTLEKARIEFT